VTQQADLTSGRIVLVDTAGHAAAPTDGLAGTAPDFVMSPESPAGLRTTGLLLILKSPAVGGAIAGGTGFSVTPWLRNPISGVWGSGTAFTVAYNQAFVTYDFDAAELYFQISAASVATPGNLYFNLCEQ
jgi:hypothetical protein